MKINICIPVFNEEENLPSFIKSLDSYLSKFDNKNFELNVVFYNDGSSDNSLEILKSIDLKKFTPSLICVEIIDEEDKKKKFLIFWRKNLKRNSSIFIKSEYVDATIIDGICSVYGMTGRKVHFCLYILFYRMTIKPK